jgi:hypothetical protein
MLRPQSCTVHAFQVIRHCHVNTVFQHKRHMCRDAGSSLMVMKNDATALSSNVYEWYYHSVQSTINLRAQMCHVSRSNVRFEIWSCQYGTGSRRTNAAICGRWHDGTLAPSASWTDTNTQDWVQRLDAVKTVMFPTFPYKTSSYLTDLKKKSSME